MVNKRVVLLGKTNVGKSSVYNVLTKGPRALVSAKEHVTRDALVAPLRHISGYDPSDLGFLVEIVDLAGFDFQKENFINFNRLHTDFFQALKEHVFRIIDTADLILALFDLKNITTIDREMILWLRKKNALDKSLKGSQSIIYTFNKVDNEKEFSFISEAYDLGISDPIFISAKSKRGLNDLVKTICSTLKSDYFYSKKSNENLEKNLEIGSVEEDTFVVSIIGKPNAGKSSLLNTLLKSDRALVSDMPGTTRDSISCEVMWQGMSFKLFDTAGMRRKSQKKDEIEESSIFQSIKSIKSSTLSILLVDATLPISEQDKKISSVAFRRNKALIVLFNKWDLVQQNWKDFLDRQLFLFPLLKNFILLPISTKNGYHVSILRKKILHFQQLSEKSYATALINRILQQAIKKTEPSSVRVSITKNPKDSQKIKWKHVALKPLYAVHLSSLPFVLKIFCHHVRALKPAYESYLMRIYRDAFALTGVPIRFIFEEIKREERNR